MTHVSESEQRFLEGRGIKYMVKSGHVRCQAVSKSQLKLLRIERQNPDLKSEDVWPLGQCTKEAVEGTYLCSYHGGSTPTIRKRSLYEYMPLDLQEKYLALQDTNQLMDRSRELAELTARKAELYEQLDDLVPAEEAFKWISESRKAISAGDITKASALLDTILSNPRTDLSIHREIQEIDKIIDKITSTQFNMLEKMRQMATSDQVSAIVGSLYSAAKTSVEKHVSDPDTQARIFDDLYNAILALRGAKAAIDVG